MQEPLRVEAGPAPATRPVVNVYQGPLVGFNPTFVIHQPAKVDEPVVPAKVVSPVATTRPAAPPKAKLQPATKPAATRPASRPAPVPDLVIPAVSATRPVSKLVVPAGDVPVPAHRMVSGGRIVAHFSKDTECPIASAQSVETCDVVRGEKFLYPVLPWQDALTLTPRIVGGPFMLSSPGIYRVWGVTMAELCDEGVKPLPGTVIAPEKMPSLFLCNVQGLGWCFFDVPYTVKADGNIKTVKVSPADVRPDWDTVVVPVARKNSVTKGK